MKKIFLASLLALGLSLPSFAAEYYLVVPLPGKLEQSVPSEPEPEPDLSVLLSAYTLPAGQVSTPYSFDLNAVLEVQGDTAYQAEHVGWRIGSGALPAGIELQPGGQLSGTPTAKNETGAQFEVIASYKGKEDQQTYTIVIEGVAYSVVALDTESNHACLIAADGAVYCWGRNTNGQLGIGSFENQTKPRKVLGLPEAVASITLGATHSCAKTVSGAVYCWGAAAYVGAGEGVVADTALPLAVQGLTGSVRTLVAGDQLTCALLDSGSVQCWGRVLYGALGDGVTMSSKVAIGVSDLNAVTSLAVGGDFACATQAGAAYCWGNGGNGRLGNGGGPATKPVLVNNLGGTPKSVLAGTSHACAVLTTNQVQCWGACYSGRCGFPGLASQKTPDYVIDQKNVALAYSQIYMGKVAACGVPSSGGMHCWGTTPWRTLDVSTPITEIPHDVKGLSVVGHNLCAVYADATAHCAGANTDGQLGDGTQTTRTTMGPVSTPEL